MALSITKIFKIEEINELMDKSQTLTVEFIVDEPIDRVWLVVSDADLLRRKLRMNFVDFTYCPVEEGGSILEGSLKAPFGKAHFFERPFEWVTGRYSYGERLYDAGPMRYGSVGFYIEKLDAQRTMVRGVMKVVLKGPLKLLLLRKLQKTVARFPELINNLLQRMKAEKPQQFEPSLRRTPDQEKLKHYTQVLQKLQPFHDPIAAMADYAARASSRFLQRLRPYAIADYYKIPRPDMLSFFLEGTQIGLFTLNWDILCPACRGAKRQSRTLRELEPKVHCEACGINFDVIDSKDVELSFCFAGDLAVPAEQVYCIGNPGRSPSIHIQLPVAPGESRRIHLNLTGRTYRLRDMKLGHVVRIAVDPQGCSTLDDAMILAAQQQNQTLLVQPQTTFQWHNMGQQWQVLRFDCLDPNLDAATADQVASVPAYQHLFGDDALRPGMDLGVGHLVFLFSDIRGSTQIYKDLGDSKAFRMVQDHFAIMEKFIKKEQGTVVKTIGDAVMASFTSEQAAIAAAVAIQKHYDLAISGPTLPRLKIGLHSGPCIMVNLNDRMDYFGTTVNTCSRLLDLAVDEDIIISDSVFQLPRVQELLKQEDATWSKEQHVLRGLQQSQTIYRITLKRQLPVRLTS